MLVLIAGDIAAVPP